MKIKQGHVAVITGGGGGIARSLAVALAERGCHLALVDINQEALEKNKRALSEFSVNVSLHTTDITNLDHTDELRDEVLKAHGKVNILINGAGLTLQKSFATHTSADWDRIVGVNLMGSINCCRSFLSALKSSGERCEAHIVNLSSLTAFVGLPNQAGYCLTKAAIRSLSETLYAELRPHGVGVTSVHPGAIKTDMLLATLHESDDIEVAKRSVKLVEKVGNTPEYAAQKMIQAIEKQKVRIRIGKDSIIVDILKRLLPSGFPKRIAAMSSKQKLVS